jgi:hypothetical protein
MGEDKAALTGTPAGTTGPTTASAPQGTGTATVAKDPAPQGTGTATVAKDPAPQSAGPPPMSNELVRQIAEQIAAGTTVVPPPYPGEPPYVEFFRRIAKQIADGTPLSGDPGNAGKK